MVLKSKEAAGKYCPMVHAALPVRDLHETCVADQCMAWRTAGEDGAEGYCGMAGKPSIVALTEMHAAQAMQRDLLGEVAK